MMTLVFGGCAAAAVLCVVMSIELLYVMRSEPHNDDTLEQQILCIYWCIKVILCVVALIRLLQAVFVGKPS